MDAPHLDILPVKSAEVYRRQYESYKNWKKTAGNYKDEFAYLSAYVMSLHNEGIKMQTIRTYVSEIAGCLRNDEINIPDDTWKRIQLFISNHKKIEPTKQSSVFTAEDIAAFLSVKNDLKIYQLKALLIIGFYGALRYTELHDLRLSDITRDDTNMRYIVTIRRSKTDVAGKSTQVFIPFLEGDNNNLHVLLEYIGKLEKYVKTTKNITDPDLLWRAIRGSKFTNQPRGVNYIAKCPSMIAEMLHLPNPGSYTGHCFRRSAATSLAASGATDNELMTLGRWRSPNVAHRYVEESGNLRWKVSQGITGGMKCANPIQTPPVGQVTQSSTLTQ